SCDICIGNDEMVSGRHCTLSPKDGRILVQDAGSLNGTRVNGVPVVGFFHAESDSLLGVGRTEVSMRLLPPGASLKSFPATTSTRATARASRTRSASVISTTPILPT